MKYSFWSINFGLFAMVMFSLLPVGLMQTWASVKYGYWYARSAEFLQTPLMNNLRWTRAFGDTIFAIGVFILLGFILNLSFKFYKKEK
jgi:nitric oxide reductase subunit B